MAHPDNSEEIEKIRAYATTVETVFNAIDVIPRSVSRYPFDTIALELVSKAFALSRACISLLDAGFPDESFGLSRSLVECALTLRYMTQERGRCSERTMRFINYMKADKAYWMYQALQTQPEDEMKKRIFEHAEEFGVEPDARAASKHWSGLRNFSWETFQIVHPLDRPSSDAKTKEQFERTKKQSYAVEYKHPSSFVHCVEPAIDNYIPDDGMPFRIAPSSGATAQPSQSTLFILLSYLYSTMSYALFGMNVDRPATLNALFSETLNKMKPFKRLHS